MLAHVITIPTLLAKNRPMSNVANAVTGFMAGSCVSWHFFYDCPAISMTHVAITPMEIMVMFKKTMVRLHELTHTVPFLRLFCTKLHHYNAIFSEALMFFLYVQKIQPTYWQNLRDVLSICSLAGCENIFSQCRANIFDMLQT